MVLVHAAGQAHDGAAGVLVPVRRTQTGERRHDVAAVRVPDLLRHVLAVAGVLQQMQLVPQPLDSCARYKNRTFQRVIYLSIQPPRHGGDQPVLGEYRLLAGVHQQKAARAEGAFGLAPGKAGLAEQRGLLVARRPRDLDLAAEVHRVGVLVELAVGHGTRQHTARYIENFQYLVVPVQRVDVEHHRPAGVGVVGHVDLAAGQLPDEPRLHRAEQQVAALGTRAHAGHVVQDPLELCGREVGVDDQPGLLPDQVGQAAGLQLVAVLACAAALPDNGVVDRLAGVTVPDDGRLALVRDADGGDVLRRRADLVHGRQRHAELGRPDLVGVMLDPAGLGEILGELLLRDAAHLAPGVKKDAAVGRGARVQRHDIFLLCHRGFSFLQQKIDPCLYYTGCSDFMRVAKPPNFSPYFWQGWLWAGQARHTGWCGDAPYKLV